MGGMGNVDFETSELVLLCVTGARAAAEDAANMVSLCFLRWHRFAQSAHIAKAHAELQSSDNLVHFLSSTLLGEMRPGLDHPVKTSE